MLQCQFTSIIMGNPGYPNIWMVYNDGKSGNNKDDLRVPLKRETPIYVYFCIPTAPATPSETVFGVVFWGLFTPSQRVFGALGIVCISMHCLNLVRITKFTCW